MSKKPFDILVIGSGPAGQRGAIAAAKRDLRVAVVDRRSMIGGASLHTGTIPSKTLREAILFLTGFRQRSFYGKGYRIKQTIKVSDLSFRVRRVLEGQLEVVNSQLRRNGITIIDGLARFVDAHTVEVRTRQGRECVTADKFLIACGTRPARSPDIPFDGKRIFDSDQIQDMKEIPRRLIVVGAGVIGLEYASMFSALDTEVTIIDARPSLLDFVDREIIDALTFHMRRMGATFRLGEKVVSIKIDSRTRVCTTLESGKKVYGDALLYTVGRQANTDTLGLDAVGLNTDERGRIKVNEHYQTKIPHIYASGDVIGFPALASTSFQQGRLASEHMFGEPGKTHEELYPYGIYTIPEISMVGKTEQELTKAKTPYEIGIARYEELAKGQMMGTDIGFLKILFDPDSLKLHGVHAIGENAAEIVHIGQAVLAFGGTMEYFLRTVFNYPTMAEAYKVAALNGLNKV